MDRRHFVSGIGAAVAVGLAAQGALAQEHKGHELPKGGKDPSKPLSLPLTKQQRGVIDTASKCLDAGEICLAHCTDNLSTGDSSMADCQRSVMNMLALVGAMHKVASYRSAKSGDIKSLARVCADYCKACEKACEPHASHHQECKDCQAACKDCAAACEALIKA